MNDIVILAKDLKKVYRLYSKPHYRLLDMFGLLAVRPGRFTEHAALDGISLEVRRGEKVAFIGRNGAGKSTLLKLITSVIEPTAGELRVAGKAHALLQIGTGFHPDFTGRQNIYAYLAQLGVSGREADRQAAMIVEFAEIEEYIDQPVKTYSSGMSVRLMFATSTAITPDLLILDEVLGVGDAYFARKSYDRIRELCERDGTTLLLVSHDVYSASRICTRMIWLDHGRVVADLPSNETLKLYEDDIRRQEESRLRRKSLEVIRRSMEAAQRSQLDVLTVEVTFAGTQASVPVHLFKVAVLDDGARLVEASPGDESAMPPGVQLVFEGTAWGQPRDWNGRMGRALQHFGSVFGRVAVVFALPRLALAAERGMTVEVEMAADAPVEVVVRTYINSAESSAHKVHVGPEIQTVSVPVAGEPLFEPPVVRSTIGNGSIVLRGARMLDGAGRESRYLEHGHPATLEFDYEIRDMAITGPLDLGVSILRGGVETACRFFTRRVHFDAGSQPLATVQMHLPSLTLGVGVYTVTVMVARLGYADQQGHVFFSINPDVFVCVRDIIEFEVHGGNLFASGTPVLADAEWHVVASAITPEPSHD